MISYAKIIVVVLLSVWYSTCMAQNNNTARVVFYNTENLYDTIDDPKISDEEFTPTGTMHWTSERYLLKIDHISSVLSAICASTAPVLIGLSEIENEQVATDLAQSAKLSRYHLGVIEKNSPDPRGIDVAMLYNKDLITVLSTEFLTVTLPDVVKGTRDILYLKCTWKGQEIHAFVNHWPSRRDGSEETAIRRKTAANVVKSKTDKILQQDAHANIIVMGDLNDNPTDSSIVYTLGAGAPEATAASNRLYNLMAKLYKTDKYTLKYRGENNIFDQMLVSGSLLNKSSKLQLISDTGNIFKEKWMLYTTRDGGDAPNRTYSGPKYHGGYSDHLPVYLDLTIAK